MSGKVQLAGVLHEQHGVGLPGSLVCGLPMRLAEGSRDCVRLMEQTAGRLQLVTGAGLLRQTRLRSRSERRASGAASGVRIAQSRIAPLLLRPARRIREGTENHVSRL